MIKIHLPWPDKNLSPNTPTTWKARMRHRKKAHATGKSIVEAYEYSEEFLSQYRGQDLAATIIFRPPDRHRRDFDNLIASMKGYQDGIFEALGMDDSQIKEQHAYWSDAVKGGEVEYIIEVQEVKPRLPYRKPTIDDYVDFISKYASYGGRT